MGLDIFVMKGNVYLFSFRAGSYSGFHEWRVWLANQVDICLDEMDGFAPHGIGWDKDVPFKELLNHSDCDGKLNKRECKALKKDFDAYALKIMRCNKAISEREVDWDVERYMYWKKSVDMVCSGEADKLVFC